MHRCTVWSSVVLVAVVLAGCGAVNKGTAFADQFRPFLESRENVQDSTITASNTLPWTGTADVSVTLVEGLSDDEVVEEVWEITAHEVDDHVAYGLQVNVMAQNADGGPALTGFEIGVPGPAPDDDGLRADIAEELDRAQALAALGSGETSVEAYSTRTTLTTQADALTIADQVCADDELAELRETLTVEGALPTGPSSRVVLGAAADCDWLEDGRAVLDALAVVAPVAAYDLTRQVQMTQPRLRASVVGGDGTDLSAAQTLASQRGLTLEIVPV